MMKERYLRSVRLLAECYHAFEHLSAQHVRQLGLTPAQFDILATLGNTPGMSFKELGEKTLITKGTLTGVVDRMEAKGFVRRVAILEDRRSTCVQLTARGQDEFERAFAPHIAHCKRPFADLDHDDFTQLEQTLTKLKSRLLDAPAKETASASVSTIDA